MRLVHVDYEAGAIPHVPPFAGSGVAYLRRTATYRSGTDATYGLHVSDTPPADTPWIALLREITTRPGWSVRRLAEKSGLNRATIYRWLRGDSANVSMASVRLIAEAGDIDVARALRAAGAAGDLQQDDDWEIATVVSSGLPPALIELYVRRILERRKVEEAARRVEVAREIELLREAASRGTAG